MSRVRTVLILFFLFVSFVLPSFAQQQPPDAPSASAQKANSGQQAPNQQVVEHHSIFFPNLATDRTPLTVSQKAGLWVKNSVAPSAWLGSAVGAGIAQATNSPSGYGQGAEGYGKRFGAAMATHATTEFAGTFVIASIARQDPRYFVHGQGTFGQRFGYALSRVVVAPNDGGGYGFNWGGVLGPLVGESVANAYLPVHEQTGARTAQRYAAELGVKAGTNVLREFWPDIFKHLGLHQ
jgi:hypothetical protein